MTCASMASAVLRYRAASQPSARCKKTGLLAAVAQGTTSAHLLRPGCLLRDPFA
jgi:hypothetical protein